VTAATRREKQRGQVNKMIKCQRFLERLPKARIITKLFSATYVRKK
jgi:hypothetical protein